MLILLDDVCYLFKSCISYLQFCVSICCAIHDWPEFGQRNWDKLKKSGIENLLPLSEWYMVFEIIFRIFGFNGNLLLLLIRHLQFHKYYIQAKMISSCFEQKSVISIYMWKWYHFCWIYELLCCGALECMAWYLSCKTLCSYSSFFSSFSFFSKVSSSDLINLSYSFWTLET